MKEYQKNIFLAGLISVVTLFAIEIGGHIIYRLTNGVWIWSDQTMEVFNIRSYMDYTDDERIIAPRKDFVADPTFGFAFDKAGFRSGLNQYDSRVPNIVFLGDSVPFGYGVYSNESLPSQFFETMFQDGYESIGVINAGVPSYSLHQAVFHYKYAIHGQGYPISIVVVQVLDPANQLNIWGSKWNRTISWTTRNTSVKTDKWQKRIKSPFYRYSAIGRTLMSMQLQGNKKDHELTFDPSDEEVKKMFIKENTKDLETLYELVRSDNAFLVLLPANLSVSYKQALQEGSHQTLYTAISYLNESMKQFAQEHDYSQFYDVVDEFDRIGRDNMFVDDCCHLSRKGNKAQADYLLRMFKQDGILNTEPE